MGGYIEKLEIACEDMRVMISFILGICASLVSAQSWCITHHHLSFFICIKAHPRLNFFMENKILHDDWRIVYFTLRADDFHRLNISLWSVLVHMLQTVDNQSDCQTVGHRGTERMID